MSNDINLFQRTSVSVSKSLPQQFRLIRIVALFLLFIVPTGTIILFLLIFFSPIKSLQEQEGVELAKANSLQTQVANTLFINDRSLASAQFMSNRSIYRKALQEITTQAPTDVSLNTITMQDTSVNLSVSSSSLDSLRIFQANLLAVPPATQALTSIAFQTIALSQDGTYQMTFQANINE